MTEAPAVGLMRNLGRFVGHLVAGVQTKPGAPVRQEVRRSVEEQTRGDGVVLRRTVIEEVEVSAARVQTDDDSVAPRANQADERKKNEDAS